MYYGIFILENCYYCSKLEKPYNIIALRDLNCFLDTSSDLAPNMRIKKLNIKFKHENAYLLSTNVHQVPRLAKAVLDYNIEIMTISGLELISNFWKPRPKQVPQRPRLFMTGLNQKVFLNQWGEPETQVALNQLGKLDKLRVMFLIGDPAEAAQLSVWIYEKKNSVLLFTKEKLVFHFSCKKFRQRLEEGGNISSIG
jgi:hypothetical protein